MKWSVVIFVITLLVETVENKTFYEKANHLMLKIPIIKRVLIREPKESCLGECLYTSKCNAINVYATGAFTTCDIMSEILDTKGKLTFNKASSYYSIIPFPTMKLKTRHGNKFCLTKGTSHVGGNRSHVGGNKRFILQLNNECAPLVINKLNHLKIDDKCYRQIHLSIVESSDETSCDKFAIKKVSHTKVQIMSLRNPYSNLCLSIYIHKKPKLESCQNMYTYTINYL